MSSSGDKAVSRTQAARERGHELQERLERLRAGEPVTADDVSQAEQAADRQRALSALAHRRAADKHRESAGRHREASDLLDATGQPERAAEHRRRAEVDDQAATVDDAAGQADEQHDATASPRLQEPDELGPYVPSSDPDPA